MITKLIVILCCVLLSLALVTGYLSVNDLRGCDIKPSEKTSCQKVDAVIAISGGNTSARAQEAIDLYKNGWADVIVFSGAARDDSGPSNARVMKRQAVEQGVPEQDVIVEEFARTTMQNAQHTTSYLSENNIMKVILVTSGYHQRRASLEFRAQAGSDIEVINHPTSHDPEWGKTWWVSPRGWWLAGGEIVKIAVFYGENLT